MGGGGCSFSNTDLKENLGPASKKMIAPLPKRKIHVQVLFERLRLHMVYRPQWEWPPRPFVCYVDVQCWWKLIHLWNLCHLCTVFYMIRSLIDWMFLLCDTGLYSILKLGFARGPALQWQCTCSFIVSPGVFCTEIVKEEMHPKLKLNIQVLCLRKTQKNML